MNRTKSPNLYYPPTVNPVDRAVWDRINYLLTEIAGINARLAGLGTGRQEKAISELKVQIAVVQDALTQAGTFVNAGNSAFNSSSVTIAASGDGFSITGSSDAGVINVDNPVTARAALGAAEAETPGAHTITLLKLTGGGADGSITWNADGVVSAFVDPT